MMFLVIAAKAHRRRKRVRQVGDDRNPFVGERRFEDRIVNRVVNDDEHGVIGESADAIGGDNRQPPIAEAQMAEEGGERRLAENHGNGDHRGQGIMADKASDFRMRRQDLAAALRMRAHRPGRKEGFRGKLLGSRSLLSNRNIHAEPRLSVEIDTSTLAESRSSQGTLHGSALRLGTGPNCPIKANSAAFAMLLTAPPPVSPGLRDPSHRCGESCRFSPRRARSAGACRDYPPEPSRIRYVRPRSRGNGGGILR